MNKIEHLVKLVLDFKFEDQIPLLELQEKADAIGISEADEPAYLLKNYLDMAISVRMNDGFNQTDLERLLQIILYYWDFLEELDGDRLELLGYLHLIEATFFFQKFYEDSHDQELAKLAKNQAMDYTEPDREIRMVNLRKFVFGEVPEEVILN